MDWLKKETREMPAAFHVRHPEIALVPAHDRTAWEAVFGAQPRCLARR